jgi:hypothetical protein
MLLRPVDPIIGLAVNGDTMHSPLYQTRWLAVHVMAAPSTSCPRYLTPSWIHGEIPRHWSLHFLFDDRDVSTIEDPCGQK